MMRPKPLLDFEPRGRTDLKEIELVPFYTEQPTMIVLRKMAIEENWFFYELVDSQSCTKALIYFDIFKNSLLNNCDMQCMGM